ncbi:MAG: glycosyltransferase family 2 protein [Butyrivibrio sp.]|nr:glycosyltransferase family 2 protein [Muribaculum sp.]MCM1553146.1 glycosyltransferase family 2 protein [Butyrivibrio sp.]
MGLSAGQEGLVSIIVPVYNVEKYITETIESVRRQTYKNWELLLVEDCSTDGSRKAIEEYLTRTGDARIRLIALPANGGAARARNRGLSEAKGRYIAYLDADDLWESVKLEHELAFMEKQQAAFAFTGYEFADENGKGLGKIVHVPATLNYKQALKNTTIFTTTVIFDTALVPKDLLDMPEVKSEDTALWWKVLRNGYIAYGLDENLVKYRRAGASLSSNKIKAIRRIWNLYRHVEGIGVVGSVWNLCFWAVRAVLRRI